MPMDAKEIERLIKGALSPDARGRHQGPRRRRGSLLRLTSFAREFVGKNPRAAATRWVYEALAGAHGAGVPPRPGP